MATPLPLPNNTVPTPPTAARLSLKPTGSTSGYVDGAWWPASDDLTIEMPALMAQLSDRWGSVHRVSYDAAAWASAPRRLTIDGRRIRLDGFRGRRPSDVVHVRATDGTAGLTLLVVPPSEESAQAEEILARAAATSNLQSADDLLHHRDFSDRAGAEPATVTSAAAARRTGIDQDGADVGQWDAEGGHDRGRLR
jgi:hypothetical protein